MLGGLCSQGRTCWSVRVKFFRMLQKIEKTFHIYQNNQFFLDLIKTIEYNENENGL